MEKLHHSIRVPYNLLVIGLLTFTFLILVLILIFYSFIFYINKIDFIGFFNIENIFDVFYFTFWQSLLTAFFSICLSIIVVKSLSYDNFFTKFLILLLSTVSVLPTVIVVFGILNVYGRNGLVSKILNFFGIEYKYTIYGVHGVIFTNIFLNIPLAIHSFHNSLNEISIEQKKIMVLLNMTKWKQFKFIEWTYIKRQIPITFSLIFISCFTNFTVPLIIGGGPSSTTIEISIYQSLNYEFNFSKTAILSVIHITCCFVIILMNKKSIDHNVLLSRSYLFEKDKNYYLWNKFESLDKIKHFFIILFFLPPILSIILEVEYKNLFCLLKNKIFLISLVNSCYISTISGIFCIFFSILVLRSNIELRFYNFKKLYILIDLISLLISTIPSLVFSISIFFICSIFDFFNFFPNFAFIISNMFTCFPYAIKMLKNPMNEISSQYRFLCLSLNISEIKKFFLIEIKVLKYLIIETFIFSFLLSIGNFGAISILKHGKQTLLHYLYNQLNTYHDDNASGTIFIIFTLYLFLFVLLNYLKKLRND
ncbi:hypothetical protein AOQ88_01310 [Candidatus Riesia sp. GBBU]|nr:hypothetical protein AOQ88_01310 [Candidatus Riesia sp. GBBU]